MCQQMCYMKPTLTVHFSLIALAHADIECAIADTGVALDSPDPFDPGFLLSANRANIHNLLLRSFIRKTLFLCHDYLFSKAKLISPPACNDCPKANSAAKEQAGQRQIF